MDLAMSHPDLFVVCKSCGSEVSPYVTECPYCGTRLRKRAPKIEREGGVPKPPRPPRRKLGRRKEGAATPPRLSRLRKNEIPGIRTARDPSAKPWATILLVALSFGVFISLAFVVDADLTLSALSGDPWRFATAPFLNENGWAQFASVVGLGVFGWLLERRHGPLILVLVFALCGVGGVAASEAIVPSEAYYGTHGAALGLLAAWSVPVLLGRRRGHEDDADMLGVAVLAAVLALIPLAVDSSMLVAGLGLAIGVLCGLLLALLRPR
jgi:membrane associated rhomboid family serine protease